MVGHEFGRQRQKVGKLVMVDQILTNCPNQVLDQIAADIVVWFPGRVPAEVVRQSLLSNMVWALPICIFSISGTQAST